MQLRGVAKNRPEVLVNLGGDLHCARESIFDNADDLGERMFDLEDGTFALDAASERENLLDNACATMRAALERVEQFPRTMIGGFVPQQLDREQNGRENVV